MPRSIDELKNASQEWPSRVPIVHPVQPTSYVVVNDDELKSWEQGRIKALRLPPDLAGRLESKTATWSFCPIGDGFETFDDSDEI
jgi:hypothetical protein